MSNQYDWDQTGFDVNDFASSLQGHNNGELVRRNGNQQLTRQNRNSWDPDTDPIPSDDRELTLRAQEARSDAIAKKRQIPPFVQKLSSFLDSSKNTDLILWSDDGNSFIVLDEEEFAKTLIPELFKHNNYASFVRQLNMYGFHKLVGLSDNSMKASENKRKTPSRYSNPFFRRGRPDLLWLIHKPKTAPGAKRNQEIKGEPDDDSDHLQSNFTSDFPSSKATDLVTLPKGELDQIKADVVSLKKQNQAISAIVNSFKRQSQEAQQQIKLAHERHENSINAIMTFLATFYNRSLEDSSSNKIQDMFNQGLPQSQNTMVDMSHNSDLQNMQFNFNSRPNRSRRPLLLPAPEIAGQVKSLPPSNSNSPIPPTAQPFMSPHSDTFAPATKTNFNTNSNSNTDSNSNSNLNSVNNAHTDTNPSLNSTNLEDVDIMSLINAVNANSPVKQNSDNFDFNSALQHMQTSDGNSPLTNQQTNEVLQKLSNEANVPVKANSPVNTSNAVEQQLVPKRQRSLSPINQRLFDMSPPNIDQLLKNNASVNEIQKLQLEQAKNLKELASRLGSLTPTGEIPGLQENHTKPASQSDWDLEDWLHQFPETTAGQADFDPDTFNLSPNDNDLFNDNHNARVQSVSSRGVSPATVATIEDNDNDLIESPNRKRRRVD